MTDFHAQAVAAAARVFGESSGDSVPFTALVAATERALQAEAERDEARTGWEAAGASLCDVEDERDALERSLRVSQQVVAEQRDRLAAAREALEVIATCPPEAVHLMPLAAQAALRTK